VSRGRRPSGSGKLGETCNQYLTKGEQVYVEGRLKTRTYQTQAGETRFSLDVTCTEIQFLGGGQGQGQAEGQDQDQEPVAVGGGQEVSEDLPF